MVKVVKKSQKKKKENLLIMGFSSILVIVLIALFVNTDNPKKEIVNEKLNSKEIIQSILNYNLDKNVDQTFLEWINENYSTEVLTKIKKSLEEATYNSNIWHKLTTNSLVVLLDKYNSTNNDRIKEITIKNDSTTLSFIGDVSLADNWYIMPKYDEREQKIYGILSKEVVDIMTTSDLMIANNEFTISNRGEKMPNKYYTFRASPNRLSIYEEMGVDLVTLANNHIYDFGTQAFYDALDYLDQYNIPYIGAGRNTTEAKQPYYFIINGYKIAFVNATRAEKYILTPEATEITGGVFRCYDPTNFIQVIKDAKAKSDFVISLVHWGKEDSTELEQVQVDTSKLYIEAGADIIVGTHAHTLQGIDFYNNKAIIYNLGDFIFNNETKDTGIFQLRINSTGQFEYYFIPCKESNEYTYLLAGAEKERVLNKMRDLSPNVEIDNNGQFYPKEKFLN